MKLKPDYVLDEAMKSIYKSIGEAERIAKASPLWDERAAIKAAAFRSMLGHTIDGVKAGFVANPSLTATDTIVMIENVFHAMGDIVRSANEMARYVASQGDFEKERKRMEDEILRDHPEAVAGGVDPTKLN